MRVSAEWLAEHVGKHDAKAIAEKLEQVGVEVEQIIYSPKLDKRVIVADVKKVIQHPDADKLKIAELSLGQGKTSVVCGGPNLAEGQKVALVQPGVTLPNGLTIEKATIRGVESNGMIASAFELGLGDDKSGILVLEPSAKVGSPVSDIWPEDAILDLKTAANRPDLLSVLGLAREATAAAGHTLSEPLIHNLPEKGTSPKVKVDKKTKTRRYMALEITADPTQVTPDWMQRRLIASGLRPINVIVDITNYVMLEYGQPLHAFDAEKVKQPLVVRHSKVGEKLATLDGQTRKLTAEDIVIADAKGAVALAGVMGGAGSEISDKTKKIILESASFDPVSIRRTAIRHGCRTDSSARFERNLPVQLAPVGLARAVDYLAKYAKGKVVGKAADELLVWPWIQHIGIRASRVEQLLGYKLSREEIAKILTKFGIEAEPFDIVAEAKKHLGKPYVWGASFKKNGLDAFDCSYFSDYLYSLIGKWVGHTTLAQFETGQPVHTGELRPGDQVFYEGIKKEGKHDYSLSEIHKPGHHWDGYTSAIGSYFKPDGSGSYTKVESNHKGLVGHNGIYIGNGKVIHATHHEFKDGKWIVRSKSGVLTSPIEEFTRDAGYLGARRFVENVDDYVAATAPWWRPDLRTEEDLIEEVARLVGYDKVPATLPAWRPEQVEFNRFWPNLWRAQEVLKGLGFYEVMTYSFVSARDLENCGLKPKDHLKLKNPMSIEQAYLRTSLLPSLLNVVAKNQGIKKNFRLYEISKVYLPNAPGKLPDEPRKLSVISKGENVLWSTKAALEMIKREFHLEVKVVPAQVPNMHPGRGAKIYVSGIEVGVTGELHPDLVDRYKIKSPVGYLEIDLQTVFANDNGPNYQPVSRYPSVWRDVAAVVSQKVGWHDIKEVIDPALADATFLSDFTGEGIPDGKKSLAIRLEMSDAERTLTDKEAEDRLAKIVAVLKSKFKAEIR